VANYLTLSTFNFLADELYLSAAPFPITNIYFSNTENNANQIPLNVEINATIYGYRFLTTSNVLISGKNIINNINGNVNYSNYIDQLKEIKFTIPSLSSRYAPISGYPLKTVSILNDNSLNVILPPFSATTDIKIIVQNEAGYGVEAIEALASTPQPTPTNTSFTPTPIVTNSPTQTITQTIQQTNSVTPTSTLTPSPTHTPQNAFSNIQIHGGQGIDEYIINSGLNSVTFYFDYNTFEIPDNFQLYYDSNLIFESGFAGNPAYNSALAALGYPPVTAPTTDKILITKPAGASWTMTLKVIAPLGDSTWVANLFFPTPTPTVTSTNTATPELTPTSKATPTITASNTPTETPASTPLATPTNTPSYTATPTLTRTPRITPTNTSSQTATSTQTKTPTQTPSNTASLTPTITITKTFTLTPSNTVTPTYTPTNTRTPTYTPTQTPTNSPRSEGGGCFSGGEGYNIKNFALKTGEKQTFLVDYTGDDVPD